MSCARKCFLTVSGKYVPPLTVASFAIIMHSMPLTRPIPATTPAHGIACLYTPKAANCEISKNGEPSSINVFMRSRTNNLPRPSWRSFNAAPPPWLIVATLLRKSSTSADIFLWFCTNVGS